MSKTKQDHLNDLAKVAFRIDEKAARQDKRVEGFKRMATLAREGKKDSQEFKELRSSYSNSLVVTDYGDEVRDLRRIVARLRKYRF